MKDHLDRTGERALPESFESVEEYLSFLRHLFAYEHVSRIIPAGLRWLEIGFGEGYGTSLLASRAGEIVGLDTNADAVAHASRKYEKDNCSFVLYNGSGLPFEPESFDVVASFQVIEHIEDDGQFLADIKRVLKPSGQLVLTTPNRSYRLKPGQKPWNRFHVREYYPHELEALLNSVFSVVTICGVKGKGDAQEVELNAVKRGFHDLDRFNIRHLIPSSVKPALARLARRLTGRTLDRKNLPAALNKYSTADYFIIEESIDSSLDLMGICKK